MPNIEATLLDLTGEWARIYDEISDGTDTMEEMDALISQLDSLTADVNEKVANCIRMIRLFEARAIAAEVVANRFSMVAKHFHRSNRALRDYMLFSFDRAGIPRLATAIGTAYTMTTTRTIVDDKDAIPPAYLRVKSEPNLTAIREELENGGNVAGARLAESRAIVIRN